MTSDGWERLDGQDAPADARVSLEFDHDAAAALFGSTVPRRDPPSGRPIAVKVASAVMIGWGAISSLAAAGALVVSGVPVWLLEKRDVRDWFEGRPGQDR
jgi:hypothetical protein